MEAEPFSLDLMGQKDPSASDPGKAAWVLIILFHMFNACAGMPVPTGSHVGPGVGVTPSLSKLLRQLWCWSHPVWGLTLSGEVLP